jgi:hypothetical protein
MYRYNESCSCGSHLLLEAPVEQSYNWAKMVSEWRANHTHSAGWMPTLAPQLGGLPVEGED